MPDDFDVLLGNKVSLHRFNETCITPEYLDWLHDSEVVRYSNQRFRKHTEQTCSAYLASFDNSANLFIAIRMRNSGRMIGTMTAYISIPHGTADIGLMVGDRTQWGKGVGLDAWKTLLRHLLTVRRMRKVTGGTLRCNIGMIRIMEKSGMQLEAVRTKQQMVEGDAQDELYFAIFGN
jgi:ribosomal-protein-alanine N-acetyltransferase